LIEQEKRCQFLLIIDDLFDLTNFMHKSLAYL